MPLRGRHCPARAVARALAVSAMIVLSGCAQSGSGAHSDREPRPGCAGAGGYRHVGTASWYGKFHHGRRTASGARFDMYALTAAHRSLPFGSRIRVTNRANGRSIVLTVNDRGPFVSGRFLDVSWRAARELNFARAGLATVLVETVEAC